MASNVGNVEELITCLIGMGFEPEDCRQAVQIGKLDVQTAVEWILAGKPSNTSGQANTLKLYQSDSAPTVPAPGVTVLGQPPIQMTFSDDTPSTAANPSATSSPYLDDNSSADNVVSRCHMSNEQRQSKDKFHDKQRDEARKSAQQDKLAKKRAHERAIQQIKEDREKQKRKTQPLKSGDSPVATVTSPKSSPSASGETCHDAIIQVRLPNGLAIKKSFSVHVHLAEVWQWVQEHYPQAANMALMQPFPRKEYTSSDLEISLHDHGLVPSGSLVLKNNPTPPAPAAEEQLSSPDATSVSDPGLSLPGPGLPSPGLPSPGLPGPGLPGPRFPGPGAGPRFGLPNPGHSWGSGAVLAEHEGSLEGGGGEELNEEPQLVQDDDDEFGMEDDDGEDIPGNFPGHNVPMPGMPNWQHGGMQQNWGAGHRLDGMFAGNQPDQRADNAKDLAAAAARRRYQNQPEASPQDPTPAPSQLHTVPRLCDLVVHDVTSRICDVRNPVMSLQGVPGNCAILMLQDLISSGKLRAKTLQPFHSCNIRTLVLDAYPYMTNELLSAVRLHTMLIDLSMANCPLINDKGILTLYSLKRLRRLSVMGCKQLTDRLFDLLKELPQLSTVTLEDTGITDAGIIAYCGSDPPPLTLENLDLSRTQITHAVLPALSKIPHLKSLCLEMTQMNSLAGIDGLRQLESLNIANTPLVTESLLCLQNHPCLKRLNISNTHQINAHLALQYLKGLKLQVLQLPDRLTTLSDSLQYITDMPLVELDLTNYIHIYNPAMEYVAQIKSLQRLRLCNTKITDDGLLSLQGLSGLSELLLDRTSISDIGASIINGANFPRLQELSLSETLVGSEYILSGHLNSCRQLVKLNLSATPLTDKGLRALKLPFLTLLNLDRTMLGPALTEDIQFDPKSVFMRCPELTRISCKNCRGTGEEDMES